MMKNNMTLPTASVSSPGEQTDTTKLVSLLALATGAVVMPQTGNADIIYTDLNSGPVLMGYSGSIDSFRFSLPGTVNFGLARAQTTLTTATGSLTFKYRTVIAGDLDAAAPVHGKIQQDANGFAVPQPFGAAWDQPGLALFFTAYVGSAGEGGHTPLNGYDHQYLAWQFSDSDQAGALRYGWMEISLSITTYPTGPNVTLYGYAYDDTGAKPTMGQQSVPEPTSMSLLALGALALGARGLRTWRRERDTAGKS